MLPARAYAAVDIETELMMSVWSTMKPLVVLLFVVDFLVVLGQDETVQFNAQEIISMVEAHNALRGRVEPSASNMQPMVNLFWWNCSLCPDISSKILLGGHHVPCGCKATTVGEGCARSLAERGSLKLLVIIGPQGRHYSVMAMDGKTDGF